MVNTHKDNNEIPLSASEGLPGNRKTFADYSAYSELSASTCATATGFGMAAAKGRITLYLAARFGAVGENIAVLREL